MVWKFTIITLCVCLNSGSLCIQPKWMHTDDVFDSPPKVSCIAC